MNFRIDQICRDNVKTCHGTEYILIDNFFDSDTFESSHNTFLSDYFVIDNTLADIISLSTHPLMDILHKFDKEILRAVNNVWQEKCTSNLTCSTLLPAGNKLNIHNDTHWPNVPIRGILYLNESFGTTFYASCTGKSPIELGGKANQLLLFKITENSYHGVGLHYHEPIDRFTINMMFERAKDKTL